MKAISIAALLALTSAAHAASTDSDVLVCAGIKEDAARLSCFDAAAKMVIARSNNLPENYILQRFKKTADK